jgi:nucleotide-binding universal stress UspA family protein
MRVLVGVDGRDHAMSALDSTIQRAREAGDEVTVGVYTTAGEQLSDVQQRVRDRLDAQSFDASVELIETQAGSGLVELAEDGEFDQIVLPGGHRSPLGKVKLDSTTEFVLLNARTTVTLIR